MQVYQLIKKIPYHFIAALLLIYFIFHIVYGNRGLISYFKLNKKFNIVYHELNMLRANRTLLEHKVRILMPESLDKDMLDEQARKILGVALPNEYIFTTKQYK